MPNIEQLDWNNLQPKTKDTIKYRKEKPKGYLKREPTAKKKPKKLKAKDKSIWSDNHNYTQHLKDIMRESS